MARRWICLPPRRSTSKPVPILQRCCAEVRWWSIVQGKQLPQRIRSSHALVLRYAFRLGVEQPTKPQPVSAPKKAHGVAQLATGILPTELFLAPFKLPLPSQESSTYNALHNSHERSFAPPLQIHAKVPTLITKEWECSSDAFANLIVKTTGCALAVTAAERAWHLAPPLNHRPEASQPYRLDDG